MYHVISLVTGRLLGRFDQEDDALGVALSCPEGGAVSLDGEVIFLAVGGRCVFSEWDFGPDLRDDTCGEW